MLIQISSTQSVRASCSRSAVPTPGVFPEVCRYIRSDFHELTVFTALAQRTWPHSVLKEPDDVVKRPTVARTINEGTVGILKQDVPCIRVRLQGRLVVLNCGGAAGYELESGLTGASRPDNLRQEMMETRLERSVPFKVKTDLLYQRLPPISPFCHSWPSVYRSSHSSRSALLSRRN